MQHTRGATPHNGSFGGFRNKQDVPDWVAWLQQQPWYSGVLFSTGYSAMGVMSYLSATVGIPLKAQSVGTAGADEYRLNGGFNWGRFVAWPLGLE